MQTILNYSRWVYHRSQSTVQLLRFRLRVWVGLTYFLGNTTAKRDVNKTIDKVSIYKEKPMLNCRAVRSSTI